MRRALTRPEGGGWALIWDLLTFERLMTNAVIHLVYWAGLGVILLAALIGPFLSPYDPNLQDLVNVLQPPSGAHLLGTDELGRDLLRAQQAHTSPPQEE